MVKYDMSNVLYEYFSQIFEMEDLIESFNALVLWQVGESWSQTEVKGKSYKKVSNPDDISQNIEKLNDRSAS